MFDVSFFELIIIGLVGLLVLGPNKLIEMARFAGKLVGKWRRQFATVKEEIDREIRVEEMRSRLAKEEAALRASMADVPAAAESFKPTESDVSTTTGVDPATGQSKPS